ncbi:MAG: toxin-antitoxin system [Rhizomicrobium sp.]
MRNIEDDVKERLRQRARRRGRSMEDEVRDILRNAVMVEPSKEVGAGTKLAGYFADVDSDFEIPEMRGEEARPASFKE